MYGRLENPPETPWDFDEPDPREVELDRLRWEEEMVAEQARTEHKRQTARKLGDDELREVLDGWRGCYGDLYSEYRSEKALYGDGGPGSACRVEDAMGWVTVLEAELARRVVPEPEWEDIPF